MHLGDATQEFTRALEVRARTMQLQQKKRQAFTGASAQPAAIAAPLPVADEVALDMGQENNGGGNQYMQQELLDLVRKHSFGTHASLKLIFKLHRILKHSN